MKHLKIAENLVHLRHRKGITQEVLADFLGVSKASVSKWETGLSMPDIVQLPRLASYYDITVDELMGYDPQLSMKEIKEYYEDFAKKFSEKEFQETIEEVYDFVRQYYSCYPALLQMVILLMNHYMLAEGPKQAQIVDKMIEICEHIQNKCLDVNICTTATIFQANIELLRGKPEVAVKKLQPYQEPLRWVDGSELVLVQAYQMLGQQEEAMEWNQVTMFRHLFNLVENSTFYVMSNLQNKEIAATTISRVEKVIATYQLEELHPNTYLKFQYAKALGYASWGQETEAVEVLQDYVKKSVEFITNAPFLHGDPYFDKLDNYYKKVEDYTVLPRNTRTILTSVVQSLEHPLFENLKGLEAFAKLKRDAEEILTIQ